VRQPRGKRASGQSAGPDRLISRPQCPGGNLQGVCPEDGLVPGLTVGGIPDGWTARPAGSKWLLSSGVGGQGEMSPRVHEDV
jgi:hypothetical protein